MRFQTTSPFYTITDTERMPSYTTLAGQTIPAGRPMTYFDANAVTGDFNGDGWTDFVVPLVRGADDPTVNRGAKPLIFLNDQRGSFVEASSTVAGGLGVTFNGRWGEAYDFNRDGASDLLYVGDGDRQPDTIGDLVTYVAGGPSLINRAGTLPDFDATNGDAPPGYIRGVRLAVGDVTGDGHADAFVIANYSLRSSQPSFLLVGDGQGRFTYRGQADFGQMGRPLPGSSVAIDTQVFDANGDGAQDIYIGYAAPDGSPVQASRIYFNDGSGGFSLGRGVDLPAGRFGSQTWSVDSVVTDLDGDGDDDLVLTQSRPQPIFSGRELQILINDGTGRYADQTAQRLTYTRDKSYELNEPYTDGHQLDLIDFNNDGHPDLIERGQGLNGRDRVGNTFSVYVNDGSGRFNELAGSAFGIVQTWPGIAAIFSPIWLDANNDGRLDFVTSRTTDVGGTLRVEFSLNLGLDDYPGSGANPPASRPIVSLEPRSAMVSEGSSGTQLARVDVVLSNPTNRDVSVRYQTVDLSATAGSDYKAATGTLTIPANATKGTIEIEILGDTLVEGNQTFRLVLAEPRNAALGTTSQGAVSRPFTITITDDEDLGPAAANLYRSMYGATPTGVEVTTLRTFAEQQLSYGARIGVADPGVFMNEAIGLALAEGTSTGNRAFRDRYGTGAIGQDAAFVERAYADVFGRQATAGQSQHFVTQVDYFEALYASSGAYGSDAGQIGLMARGAVFGQMVGIRAGLAGGSSGQIDEGLL